MIIFIIYNSQRNQNNANNPYKKNILHQFYNFTCFRTAVKLQELFLFSVNCLNSVDNTAKTYFHSTLQQENDGGCCLSFKPT